MRIYTQELIEFQYLIGRLKTWCVVVPLIVHAMFQYLIGRLKTKGALVGILSAHAVSIPYR